MQKSREPRSDIQQDDVNGAKYLLADTTTTRSTDDMQSCVAKVAAHYSSLILSAFHSGNILNITHIYLQANPMTYKDALILVSLSDVLLLSLRLHNNHCQNLYNGAHSTLCVTVLMPSCFLVEHWLSSAPAYSSTKYMIQFFMLTWLDSGLQYLSSLLVTTTSADSGWLQPLS